jgi:D-alanyl-D-alanine carboxypeptidase
MSSTMRRATATITAIAALSIPIAVAATTTAVGKPPADPGSAADSRQPHLADSSTELSRAVTQAAQEASVKQRGEEPKRSHDDVDRALDRAAKELVSDGAVGVTARLQTPRESWRGAEGVRDIDEKSRARAQDRFRVASITKPMVATLVLQEVERGTWTLDTEIDDVIPNPFPDGVTIRHLLSHRSGAPTGTDTMLLTRISDPNSVDEFIEVLGEDYSDADTIVGATSTPWKFDPGSDFNYSNAGYVMLGMMLERVTDHDVEDLLERRVFRPAGMSDTDFPEDPGTKGPFMVGAAFTGEDGKGWYSLDHFDPSVFSSSGAVVSTTRDLNDFTDALLTGELVDKSLVEEMVVPLSDDPLEYGLGVMRVPDPCTPGQYLYGHDGATYGTISIALSSPDGNRQIAAGITGRNLTADPDALYDLNELLVPMLQATCS